MNRFLAVLLIACLGLLAFALAGCDDSNATRPAGLGQYSRITCVRTDDVTKCVCCVDNTTCVVRACPGDPDPQGPPKPVLP